MEANSTGGQGSRRAVAPSDDDDDDDDDNDESPLVYNYNTTQYSVTSHKKFHYLFLRRHVSARH